MKITEGTMVIVKACLYAVIAFLTPLSGLMATAADANTQTWPTWLQLTSAVLTGIIAACIAVRAYFDGSNSRWEDNQNGSFRVKSEPPTPKEP